MEPSAALQGYVNELSVQPGSTLEVAVSTTFPSYTASVLRLAPAPKTCPVTILGPSKHDDGHQQLLGDNYRANGCGWTTEVKVPVPQDWKSGIYSVRL